MQNQVSRGIGPVLSVRSDEDKGLILNWNFTGIYSPNFQHYHLFVFIGQEVAESRTFLESYHSHLKIGEIMGVYCTRIEYSEVRKKVIWNQKSGYGSSEINLKKTCLVEEVTSELIEQICEKQSRKRGIIIFNIFCDPLSPKPPLGKTVSVVSSTVQKIRETNKEYDKIIFNVISSQFQYSKINTNLGLNFMRYERPNSLLSCQDILKYVRTITVKDLKLLLEMKDKFSIFSFSSNQWFVTDAMDMEKRYYGLPRVKFSQSIKILQLRRESSPNFQLNITLNFTFFDGRQIRDKKTLCFQSTDNKVLLQSSNATTDLNKFTNYQFAKGYFIQSNLLNQESMILLSRVHEQTGHTKKRRNG